MEDFLIALLSILGGMGVGYWFVREFVFSNRRKNVATSAKEGGPHNCGAAGSITYEKHEPLIITREILVDNSPIITRDEMVERFSRIDDSSLEIVDRFDNPRLPSSFKWRNKTFVNLFGTDKGIILVAKLPEEKAAYIKQAHPSLCPASFPKGKNWYSLLIDDTFKSKEDVMRIIYAGYDFIKTAA